jgi:hypothetical protein
MASGAIAPMWPFTGDAMISAAENSVVPGATQSLFEVAFSFRRRIRSEKLEHSAHIPAG